VVTTLAHRIDADFRREAYRQTKQASAPGIDGVTAQASADHLDETRHARYERLRRGRYQAAPVERVWSETEAGGPRPLGKPTFEDKIVQRAGAMLVAAIDEQDFYDCSSGVRPGRSPHAALQAVREPCRQAGRGWIVDAEVSGDVDRLDRTRRREVRRQRVNDGRRWRRSGKWLRAGVMEDGERSPPATGVVQGGVRSPVVAHVFLHQVVDEWLAREVRPRMKGRGVRLRVADDGVIGGAREADARRLMAVRPKRGARFGWSLPPEKTALMGFRKPDTRQGPAPGNGTFDFLGLTHDWTQARRGFWVLKRRTASTRRRRTKKALWRWCRTNRHAPLTYQDQRLCLKWRGHFRYDGIRGHVRLLEEVRRFAEQAGRYWLSRRSSTSAIGWEKFQPRRKTYVLPTPNIVHHIWPGLAG
jgi:RNA-directed DNA polymerase